MRAHHLLESHVGREAGHGIVSQGGGYLTYSYKKRTEDSIHTRSQLESGMTKAGARKRRASPIWGKIGLPLPRFPGLCGFFGPLDFG